jgi:hypothetical protein
MLSNIELLKLRYARLLISQDVDLSVKSARGVPLTLDGILLVADRYSHGLISIIKELKEYGEPVFDSVLYVFVDTDVNVKQMEGKVLELCNSPTITAKVSFDCDVGASNCAAIMMQMDSLYADRNCAILTNVLNCGMVFSTDSLELLDEDAWSLAEIDDVDDAKHFLDRYKLKLIKSNTFESGQIGNVHH